MAQNSEMLQLFRDAGSLVEKSHVVLPSWKHSTGYFDQRPLLGDYDYQSSVAKALLKLLLEFEKKSGSRITAIVGPISDGGLWSPLLRSWLWNHDMMREVTTAMTRRCGRKQIFRVDPESGFDESDYVRGRQVAILSDVITTGITTGPVINAVREVGGKPVVILSLCDRRPPGQRNRLQTLAICKVRWPMWTAQECPLCPNTPIGSDLGNGGQYQELVKLRGALGLISLGEI